MCKHPIRVTDISIISDTCCFFANIQNPLIIQLIVVNRITLLCYGKVEVTPLIWLHPCTLNHPFSVSPYSAFGTPSLVSTEELFLKLAKGLFLVAYCLSVSGFAAAGEFPSIFSHPGNEQFQYRASWIFKSCCVAFVDKDKIFAFTVILVAQSTLGQTRQQTGWDLAAQAIPSMLGQWNSRKYYFVCFLLLVIIMVRSGSPRP